MDPLTSLVVILPVIQVLGDPKLFGVEHALFNALHFLVGESTGSSVGVDSQNLAQDPSESSANALDLSQGEGDLPLSVDVGVLDTED